MSPAEWFLFWSQIELLVTSRKMFVILQ